MKFEFNALPWRIVFAAGAIHTLPEHVDGLGYKRILVISTPEQLEHAQLVASLLGARCAGVFSEAVMHVPVETIRLATRLVRQVQADCTVAIGGGSTTGLGKALALEEDLPNIVIPTTYAGSEMTNVWGMTEAGRKKTGRDNRVLPNLTIYDPELTLGLPAEISGPSGINAMAQAVVNVTAEHVNPIISALATDAIAALSQSLPIVVKQPSNLEARSKALYGACMAGAALGAGITGLHHRICHTLGGSYNTPHADTHAIVLAHSVAFNSDAVPEGTARVAAAMNVDNAAIGIFELLQNVSQKTTLADLGIAHADLQEIAKIAVESPINNPKPVTVDDLVGILNAAFTGAKPPT